MKNYLVIIIVMLGITSCNSSSEINDQTEIETEEIVEEGPDFSILRKEFIENYPKKTEFIDSVISKDDSLILKATYYCSFDSAIKLPSKYVWESDSTFITHNYLMKVVIEKNREIVLNDTFSKSDFQGVLPEELNEYAVLLFPNYDGYNESSENFEFGFSLTIPVTDVGQGKSLSINRNGEIKIK